MMMTDLVIAVDIFLRIDLKGERDTELQMSLSKELKYYLYLIIL